jgi:DNA polymerase I-like protein with 3'-5' exonuclease and polymerase domains
MENILSHEVKLMVDIWMGNNWRKCK